VKVDDSLELLDKDREPQLGKRIRVGISSGAGFLPLPATLIGRKERNYELLVPFQTPLRVVVASDSYDLADDKDKAVDPAKGHSEDVHVPNGRAKTTVTVKIKGNKK
jgi:hypothetical protein